MAGESPMVCRRCWLPIRKWGRSNGTSYWKHSSGWNSGKTCGRPPEPMPRLELTKMVAGATSVLREMVVANA